MRVDGSSRSMVPGAVESTALSTRLLQNEMSKRMTHTRNIPPQYSHYSLRVTVSQSTDRTHPS